MQVMYFEYTLLPQEGPGRGLEIQSSFLISQ